MRLIDADALEESWDILSDGKAFCFFETEEIKNAPTVDAVEVVRCKDCRHGKCVGIEYLCRAHSGSERELGEDRHYSEWHDGNWFCADGERKEADE